MVTAPARPITADEFLEMPESEGHELVCGELVEVPMGLESSWIGGELFGRLRDFVNRRKLGRVLPQETGMRIWSYDPDRVRKPDILFVRAGR